MMDSQTETASAKGELLEQPVAPSSLDLSGFPPVYILPVHLSASETHTFEEKLLDAGAKLTRDILEASLIIGAISTPRRARFELQCRKLNTEQISPKPAKTVQTEADGLGSGARSPARKRRRTSEDLHDRSSSPMTVVEIDSSAEDDNDAPAKPMSQLSFSRNFTAAPLLSSDPSKAEEAYDPPELFDGIVKVVKLDWLKDSVKSGKREKFEKYLIYEGRSPPPPVVHPVRPLETAQIHMTSVPAATTGKSPYLKEGVFHDAIERALAGTTARSRRPGYKDKINDEMQREFRGRAFVSSTQQKHARHSEPGHRPTHLLRESTSEHDEGVSHASPEMPQWVRENKIYACERSTPEHSPNDEFIDLLKKIKLARELTGDEIGVRAYSTSIASLAAYPFKLSSTKEIVALPGCDQKLAHLFHEWQESGHLEAVADIEADPALTVMRTFYDIWGVGAKTAREFYYDRKWRDLDDVIEYGWDTLSRVQQIGVKYYDEFKLKIPRSEVEFIASVVTYHAKQIIDDGIECIIVGGYRRGKAESGDVDIILSHREEGATRLLIGPVVKALESFGWITHCLALNETNSKRDQQPLPVRFDGTRGSGFDTLDKALVVWQDPHWPTREEDLSENPKAKNPNVHRRVDIIISPWRTVGCAVSGWTSGTTFQRDLRRYAKHVKGWKFDSSGVRERGTGKWIDLEKWADENTRAKTWQEAERRVFEGMGLEYREPWERCTG